MTLRKIGRRASRMCPHFEKKKLCFLRPFLDSVSTVYPDSDGGPELNAEMAKKRQKDLDRTCTVPILHTSYVSLLTTLLLLLGQKLDEVVRWLDAFHCTEKHKYTIQLRQRDTCEWFPKTDAYKTWRAGGCQFLWLHGKGMLSGIS